MSTSADGSQVQVLHSPLANDTLTPAAMRPPGHAADLARRDPPDIVCLPELKAPQSKFPEKQLAETGYGAVWHGQSRWNGVAILSRGSEPVLTRRGCPRGLDPSQSRYIEAAVNGFLVGFLYAPNGNPAPVPKWDYKLQWLKQFTVHAKQLLARDVPMILAGDYNIIPPERDVYNPERWRDNALFLLEIRRPMRPF